MTFRTILLAATASRSAWQVAAAQTAAIQPLADATTRDEIVVTPTRRNATVLEIPGNISAVGGDCLPRTSLGNSLRRALTT